MEGFLSIVLSWLALLAAVVLALVLIVASLAWRSREKRRRARRHLACCLHAASKQPHSKAPYAKPLK